MTVVENTDVAATWMCPSARENGRPRGLAPKSSYSASGKVMFQFATHVRWVFYLMPGAMIS